VAFGPLRHPSSSATSPFTESVREKIGVVAARRWRGSLRSYVRARARARSQSPRCPFPRARACRLRISLHKDTRRHVAADSPDSATRDRARAVFVIESRKKETRAKPVCACDESRVHVCGDIGRIEKEKRRGGATASWCVCISAGSRRCAIASYSDASVPSDTDCAKRALKLDTLAESSSAAADR